MTSLRLKISVSGVRGIVGETLSPQLLTRFAQAYGTYVGPGKVLVGRDTRPSGTMVADAVFAGLLATGCRPVDLGIVPIPALQHRAGQRTDVVGAICITASHNPAEWNALKLLSSDGLFLSDLEATELLDIYHQQTFRKAAGSEIPQMARDGGAVKAHLQAVGSEVDVQAIRDAKIKVAVDCVNGAGAVASPELLAQLGCTVFRIGCEPTGQFLRPPEPVPDNLQVLQRAVEDGHGQIGFAQDADADRLAVIDEMGRPWDGDTMLAVLIDLVLRRSTTEEGGERTVVVNLSTTNLVDHVAASHGAKVERSKVGEANVVSTMAEKGALVGGEGSGGLIYPKVHPCRDSFVGMALLLEHIAGGGSLAALADALPLRARIKTKHPMPLAQARRKVFALRDTFADATIDLRDGLKAVWKDKWIHVRPSNTEPLLRVLAEAADAQSAEQLVALVEAQEATESD